MKEVHNTSKIYTQILCLMTNIIYENVIKRIIISKAIGHINACGCELSKDETRYLLEILKGEEYERN